MTDLPDASAKLSAFQLAQQRLKEGTEPQPGEITGTVRGFSRHNSTLARIFTGRLLSNSIWITGWFASTHTRGFPSSSGPNAFPRNVVR